MDIVQNFRWVAWEVMVLTRQTATFYLVAVYLSVISCNSHLPSVHCLMISPFITPCNATEVVVML